MTPHLGYHSIKNLFRIDAETLYVSVDDTAEHLQGMQVLVQEKCDGMNIGILFDPETSKFKFMGKERGSQIPTDLIAHLTDITFGNIDEWRRLFSTKVVVYGEGIGYGINGNRHNFREGFADFVMFDIFDVEKGVFYNTLALSAGGFECLGLLHPKNCRSCKQLSVAFRIEDKALITTLDGENFDADTASNFGGDETSSNFLEGVIIRPLLELRRNNGERVIWKYKPRELSAYYEKCNRKLDKSK